MKILSCICLLLLTTLLYAQQPNSPKELPLVYPAGIAEAPLEISFAQWQKMYPSTPKEGRPSPPSDFFVKEPLTVRRCPTPSNESNPVLAKGAKEPILENQINTNLLNTDCDWPALTGTPYILTNTSNASGNPVLGKYDKSTPSYVTAINASAFPRVTVALDRPNIGAYVTTDGRPFLFDAIANNIKAPVDGAGTGWGKIALNPQGDMVLLVKPTGNEMALYDLSTTPAKLIKTFSVVLPSGIVPQRIGTIEFSPTGQVVIFDAFRNGIWSVYSIFLWDNNNIGPGTGTVSALFNDAYLDANSISVLHPTFAKTKPWLIAYDQAEPGSLFDYTRSTWTADLLHGRFPNNPVASLNLVQTCTSDLEKLHGWPNFSPDDRAIVHLTYASNCSGIFNGLDVCVSKLMVKQLQADGLTTSSCSMPTVPAGQISSTGYLAANAPLWFADGGRQWQKPTADFMATTPTTIQPKDSVAFEYTASVCPTAWHWKFPGGNPTASVSSSPPPVYYANAGKYPVTLIVKNPSGTDSLTHMDYIIVGNPSTACDTLKTSISYDPPSPQGQVQFKGVAAGGTSFNWHWDFGDGSSADIQNPLHTYANTAADYNVVLTVANECGDTVVVTAFVKISNLSSVVLAAGKVEGSKGDTINLPVYVRGCGSLTSLQGRWVFNASSIIEVLGIKEGRIKPNTNNFSGNFSWFDGGGGVEISDTTVLFWVTVRLLGNPGDSSVVDFKDGTNLAIEVSCNNEIKTVTIETGLVKIKPKVKLSILAETCAGQPIKDAVASAISIHQGIEALYGDKTAENGRCIMSEIAPQSQVTAWLTKETNPFNGLASAFWLAQMQRFLLGYANTQIVSPCQVIASDFNGNNVVSTFDLLQMSSAAVNGFPEPYKSWVFIPKTHVFALPFTSQTVFSYPVTYPIASLATDSTMRFMGIKIGDISMKANPQNALPEGAEDRHAPDLQLVVTSQVDMEKRTLALTFTSETTLLLASFQGEIGFDASKIKIIDLEKGALEPVYKLGAASVPFAWFDLTGEGRAVKPSEPLLRLRFEIDAEFDITRENIADLVWFQEEGLPTEMYEADEQRRSPRLVFDEVLLDAQSFSTDRFTLFQVAPNPVTSEMLLSFNLPVSETVVLTLSNALGQIFLTQQVNLEAGTQSIKADVSGLPNGVYYVALMAGPERATLKVNISH